MLKWKVGDVVQYRVGGMGVWSEAETITEVRRCGWYNENSDRGSTECVNCNKLRVVLSRTGNVGAGGSGGCGGLKHCRLVRRTSRTHKETISNLRLPHLKEYLEVIGK